MQWSGPAELKRDPSIKYEECIDASGLPIGYGAISEILLCARSMSPPAFCHIQRLLLIWGTGRGLRLARGCTFNVFCPLGQTLDPVFAIFGHFEDFLPNPVLDALVFSGFLTFFFLTFFIWDLGGFGYLFASWVWCDGPGKKKPRGLFWAEIIARFILSEISPVN